ncbi:hypothetical protein CEUSTIGMA_g6597.t1 [Chlamydomonas eustigma]|uniref:Uncharacterized protein n=1 Tax=Chlamydomonas eustigma TaxID=1157962 RepID=A0A250X7W1_9CHLO|nr:hypothetical protein CEUSTIGMA_g6597.t1 [Chlamydomonas eustigma]|eukprot:GAX79157.1 hypothetical protein CEUSTIGMA_g6597.t1 [Chlamydomonas eustigma]
MEDQFIEGSGFNELSPVFEASSERSFSLRGSLPESVASTFSSKCKQSCGNEDDITFNESLIGDSRAAEDSFDSTRGSCRQFLSSPKFQSEAKAAKNEDDAFFTPYENSFFDGGVTSASSLAEKFFTPNTKLSDMPMRVFELDGNASSASSTLKAVGHASVIVTASPRSSAQVSSNSSFQAVQNCVSAMSGLIAKISSQEDMMDLDTPLPRGHDTCRSPPTIENSSRSASPDPAETVKQQHDSERGLPPRNTSTPTCDEQQSNSTYSHAPASSLDTSPIRSPNSNRRSMLSAAIQTTAAASNCAAAAASAKHMAMVVQAVRSPLRHKTDQMCKELKADSLKTEKTVASRISSMLEMQAAAAVLPEETQNTTKSTSVQPHSAQKTPVADKALSRKTPVADKELPRKTPVADKALTRMTPVTDTTLTRKPRVPIFSQATSVHAYDQGVRSKRSAGTGQAPAVKKGPGLSHPGQDIPSKPQDLSSLHGATKAVPPHGETTSVAVEKKPPFQSVALGGTTLKKPPLALTRGNKITLPLQGRTPLPGIANSYVRTNVKPLVTSNSRGGVISTSNMPTAGSSTSAERHPEDLRKDLVRGTTLLAVKEDAVQGTTLLAVKEDAVQGTTLLAVKEDAVQGTTSLAAEAFATASDIPSVANEQKCTLTIPPLKQQPAKHALSPASPILRRGTPLVPLVRVQPSTTLRSKAQSAASKDTAQTSGMPQSGLVASLTLKTALKKGDDASKFPPSSPTHRLVKTAQLCPSSSATAIVASYKPSSANQCTQSSAAEAASRKPSSLLQAAKQLQDELMSPKIVSPLGSKARPAWGWPPTLPISPAAAPSKSAQSVIIASTEPSTTLTAAELKIDVGPKIKHGDARVMKVPSSSSACNTKTCTSGGDPGGAGKHSVDASVKGMRGQSKDNKLLASRSKEVVVNESPLSSLTATCRQAPHAATAPSLSRTLPTSSSHPVKTFSSKAAPPQKTETNRLGPAGSTVQPASSTPHASLKILAAKKDQQMSAKEAPSCSTFLATKKDQQLSVKDAPSCPTLPGNKQASSTVQVSSRLHNSSKAPHIMSPGKTNLNSITAQQKNILNSSPVVSKVPQSPAASLVVKKGTKQAVSPSTYAARQGKGGSTWTHNHHTGPMLLPSPARHAAVSWKTKDPASPAQGMSMRAAAPTSAARYSAVIEDEDDVVSRAGGRDAAAVTAREEVVHLPSTPRGAHPRKSPKAGGSVPAKLCSDMDWCLVLGLTPSSSLCLDTSANMLGQPTHRDQGSLKEPAVGSTLIPPTVSDRLLAVVVDGSQVDRDPESTSVDAAYRGESNNESGYGLPLHLVTAVPNPYKEQDHLLQPGRCSSPEALRSSKKALPHIQQDVSLYSPEDHSCCLLDVRYRSPDSAARERSIGRMQISQFRPEGFTDSMVLSP